MSDNGGTAWLLETRQMKRRTNSKELKIKPRYHYSSSIAGGVSARILGVPSQPASGAVGRLGGHPQNQHCRPLRLYYFGVNPAHKHSQISARRPPHRPAIARPPNANQLEKHCHLVSTGMSANVKAFQAFLQERQTGLVQRSPPWVKARQHTIGASEMAVLTGASPFDTPASLIRKKLHPPDLSNNVACAWGKLFEPFARSYIEWVHNTRVFGDTISLNLAKDHPLYGKVTCSPDGYFQALDGSIVLLELKCPFTRKIVVNKIPGLYRDQVQTGLALSGEHVAKGLFVDCCFRMCSLSQLEMNLAHNAGPHGGALHKTKTPFPRAWGICILEQAKAVSQASSSSEPWHHDSTRHLYKGTARYLIGRDSSALQPSTRGL